MQFVVLPLISIAIQAAPVAAQTPQPRGASYVVEPEIRTKIEALMAATNRLVVTDYYRIEMRFGPNVRIDAVIATVPDTQTLLKGVRVQVRGTEASETFLDLDEIEPLSRALTSMTALAKKWTGLDDRRAAHLSFATNGGLRVVIREFARMHRVEISSGVTDPVVATVELDDLLTLKQAFDQALSLLTEKH
jgi:hypothetical protein